MPRFINQKLHPVMRNTRRTIFLSLLLAGCTAPPLRAQDLATVFEKTHGRETVTYAECIQYYQALAQRFPQTMQLRAIGETDAGFPLHLLVYSKDGDFNFAQLHQQHKRIILINNGIHPGEPDGIDASMLLLRDIALGKKTLPANIVLAVIPLYNIGGALNRSPDFRVDQNGPAAFGSRGNAQNLDLNRDFIKSDSKNARTFQQIFQLTDPDVLIDNHVSNGADYQHIMTLLTSQPDKLGGAMGDFLRNRFEPGLYALMKAKGYDLVPYVNHTGDLPDSGWVAYQDNPRYSTGYATLFHTFGFMPETHMLKPYDQRVKATYALMECFIAFTGAHSEEIGALRAQAKKAVLTQTRFPLEWKPDMQRDSLILFKGFQAGYKPSAVSGLPRLYYDRDQPFTRKVKFYNHFIPGNYVAKPQAYLIPQGWWAVIHLLQNNHVQLQRLAHDTTIEVEVYHIEAYKSAPRPYEKHFLHSGVQTSTSLQRIFFRKGDYYIPLHQAANRYLVETLEPTAGDSFFAWNFFDAILAQKEDYSAYVFEDIAADYVSRHPAL
ncbi:MAG TPA: M14 family metallopeptidase, partial [Chitinophaga sp.]